MLLISMVVSGLALCISFFNLVMFDKNEFDPLLLENELHMRRAKAKAAQEESSRLKKMNSIVGILQSAVGSKADGEGKEITAKGKLARAVSLLSSKGKGNKVNDGDAAAKEEEKKVEKKDTAIMQRIKKGRKSV